MRIAIAINGEGKGHVTRMIALSQRLSVSHELYFWAPETIAPMVSRAFPEATVLPIPFLKIVMNRERIDLLKTGIDNVDTIFQSPGTIRQLSDQFRLLRIEGLLSDFEPYSTKAARISGIPVLQLNHPGIVLRAPTLMPDAILSKVIAGSMMGDYDDCLISSFYQGDIGPILREDVCKARPEYGDHIVVYVRDSMLRNVSEALSKKTGRELRFFPGREHDFIESLATSSAVVATSGHQLSSEALHLGKPIFSIPMEGQFEQRLNAIMIERSGRGLYARMDRIEKDFDRFFSKLETMMEESRKPAPRGYCFHDESDRAASLVDRFFCSGGLPLAKKA
jgi:uncharacterized protein (TIGR00661 family)